MPLCWDAAGTGPMLDRALTAPQEGREGALPAEAADDAFGGVRGVVLHRRRQRNGFFVSVVGEKCKTLALNPHPQPLSKIWRGELSRKDAVRRMRGDRPGLSKRCTFAKGSPLQDLGEERRAIGLLYHGLGVRTGCLTSPASHARSLLFAEREGGFYGYRL